MKRTIGIIIVFFMILAGCTKQESVDEATIAQNTLTIFFDNLNKEKFDDALGYFTTDEATREGLNIYNPEGERDHDDIIENYCQATLTCLPATIIATTKVNDDEYNYQVQFHRKDGSIFILGPCCGATEEEIPPKDSFNFVVKKINGTFKVITPPLYVP